MSRKKQSKKQTKIISSIISVIIVLVLGVLGFNYEEIGNYLNIDVSSISNIIDNNLSNTINNNQLENITVNTITAEESQNVKLDENANILQIYFFDVGQADSILLISNNQSMLIDAGNNDDGDLVVQNIKNLGVTKLDYVIGTHPHEDHIGGLDDVINNFEIGTIYMPKVQTNTKTYEDVLDAISNKNLKVTSPEIGSKFEVGNVQCEVMLCGSGSKEEQSNLNLSSISIRVVYNEQSYLFMGDSEIENEKSRSWPQTNVLKVGHHGSDTSSSIEFLNQIKPQIAIISVGKDNSYGHPKQTTLDKFSKLGTIVYRTDERGNILLKSDGINNKISFY